MNTFGKLRITSSILLISFVGVTLLSGCARYARTVNDLYEPSAILHKGSGEVTIIIPASQRTTTPGIRWVLGKVTDNDNNAIDEVFSPRSAAEIIQAAFGEEFKRAGYNIVPATSRTGTENFAIDLTKTEIELEQTSAIANLKAKCRVLAGVDVYRNGTLIKRLQYEATSLKTDLRDRDLIAGTVMQGAIQSVMEKAVPELSGLITK